VLFSTEHHAKKAYWGSGSIASHILDLATRWRWVVCFTPQPIYSQEKSPWYPLDRRLGGPQSRSVRGGEQKNSQPLPGFELPDHPARSHTTEIWRLINPKIYTSNIIFNIILRSTPGSPNGSPLIRSSSKNVMSVYFPHRPIACYIPWQSHPFWFDRHNEIWWRVHITKPFVMT
jgi:hypothetical protein